jgi:hypothetical protein
MAKQNERIPALSRPAVDSLPLRFSFKYLDFGNTKFLPSKCTPAYLHELFKILHRFSGWAVRDFIDQNNDEHRHIIDFTQTSEMDGFQHIPAIDQEQFGYQEGWQFGVYPEVYWNRWRAHGILLDDTFYLVWLDEKHLLYP